MATILALNHNTEFSDYLIIVALISRLIDFFLKSLQSILRKANIFRRCYKDHRGQASLKC